VNANWIARYTGGWLQNPTYHDTHDSKSGTRGWRIAVRAAYLPLRHPTP